VAAATVADLRRAAAAVAPQAVPVAMVVEHPRLDQAAAAEMGNKEVVVAATMPRALGCQHRRPRRQAQLQQLQERRHQPPLAPRHQRRRRHPQRHQQPQQQQLHLRLLQVIPP